jgi:3-isopropylmalate/(R)-2-methylmalate dehydratase large subunit
MGYTIAEKILMAHTGKKEISPGDFIQAKIDLALGNDITAPIAIGEFQKLGTRKVFDKNKIALIPDHFAPNKDLKSANQCKVLQDFAKRQRLKHYYEVGRMGIEHALLPEQGIVMPGDVVVGADSHTCTYGALGAYAAGVGSTDLAAAFATGTCWFKVPRSLKFIFYGKRARWVGGKDLILHTIGAIGVDGALAEAMEFSGEAIRTLPVDDRLSICNMAIEAGARAGIIEPDDITLRYARSTSKISKRRFTVYKSDRGAAYRKIFEYDVAKIEPLVACPYIPSNVKKVRGLAKVAIDQAVIGSCTNGRISDLRTAAAILKGRRVDSRVRLIVIPATQAIYAQAIKEGIANIVINAGGVFSTPTCGPCLGGHMGILAKGEVAIATTNRNFVGRMGDVGSKVYLSNPAVAAASAVKGRITHPDEL